MRGRCVGRPPAWAPRWRRGGLVATATAWSWRGGPAGGAAAGGESRTGERRSAQATSVPCTTGIRRDACDPATVGESSTGRKLAVGFCLCLLFGLDGLGCLVLGLGVLIGPNSRVSQ